MQRVDLLIHLFSILLYIFTFIYFFEDLVFFISLQAIIGLLYLIFILLLPFLARKTSLKAFKILLGKRMWLGIYCSLFITTHVIVALGEFYSFDLSLLLFDLSLLAGFVAFLIIAALTLTSNKYSMKVLGTNWKRLHNLVFLALLLILYHSFNLAVYFVKDLIFLILLALSLFVVALKILYYYLPRLKQKKQ